LVNIDEGSLLGKSPKSLISFAAESTSGWPLADPVELDHEIV
jgi:hypothetical protein